MLEHGGRLRRAAARHGIPLADWLDLSTGINPVAYPVPPVSAEVWQRLPEEDDGLQEIAAAYFGTHELLPVAGSQAAIQALPALLPGARVSLLAPSYAEHAHAWRGRAVHQCDAAELDAAVDRSDVVVLVNPNNPSGVHFARDSLLEWHTRLARRGGWLIVDEAFSDAEPGASLAAQAGLPGLVVLRSLGKFFGLAGARVGFVLAPAALRLQLAEALGPWAISGPGRHAARHALADCDWQQRMRHKLAADGARLAALLQEAGLGNASGPALFKWFAHPRAAALHAALARRGILVRLFDTPASLRLGLPADEAGWARLRAGLGAALDDIA
ncbi:MAG: threonine-phosphate decarboxylase [Proteobacteria bacterium]|nr:threonine-phosphate decarboxylase [Pseudomonadota bacterium]